MEKVAIKVTDYLTQHENLDKSSKEYLGTKFGVWLILEEGSKFLSYLILFTLLGKFFEFVLAAVVLIPLRMTAGGYHTKTYWTCFFLTLSWFAAAIYIGSYIQIDSLVKATIFIALLIVMIIFSPVNNPNMPVKKPELIKKKRRNSLILFCFWGIGAIGVAYFVPNIAYLANVVILMLVAQTITLPAGVISNRIHYKKLAASEEVAHNV